MKYHLGRALWTTVIAALSLGALFGQIKAQPKSAATKALSAPRVYGYQVVKVYPHDRNAFTEGLFYLDGFLYEGTGTTGQSDVRRVELETGRVAQIQRLAPQYFGEGIINVGKQLIQLTYTTQIGFVYDLATFKLQKSFSYMGEGWGMTTDGKRIFMTDSTENIRILDPATLQQTGTLRVTATGVPIKEVNELEYIKGEIWANVWRTDRIARIDPATGQVRSWIDLSGLLSVMDRQGVDVLNGIAYDAKADRIFVTGKYWPKLFEIKVGASK